MKLKYLYVLIAPSVVYLIYWTGGGEFERGKPLALTISIMIVFAIFGLIGTLEKVSKSRGIYE